MSKIEKCCIIDDDPVFIYGTKRIMKKVDFCNDLIIFNNGPEALEGLKKISDQGLKIPEVIFLNLNMPVFNGWEFLDEFIHIPSNNLEKTLIYIISSSVEPLDLEKVKNYKNVTNYILKPITPNDLEDIIKTLSK